MIKFTILIVLVVLCVFANGNDPFKCDANGKCMSGSVCINGTCYGRTDCPQVAMPIMEAGCTLTLVPDERDCPMPKIVCDNKNIS